MMAGDLHRETQWIQGLILRLQGRSAAGMQSGGNAFFLGKTDQSGGHGRHQKLPMILNLQQLFLKNMQNKLTESDSMT